MKIIRQVIIVCAIGLYLWYYLFNGKNSDSSDSSESQDTEYSNSSQITNSSSEEYTGHYCLVCGNPCKKEKEIRSKGDAVSNYQPYYLCGENMDCVYERERQNNELKNTGSSSSNSNQADCGFCGGDGIEGYGENRRVCPMCDGKGKQSQ